MRLVRLSDLSDEERKRALNEQQIRINENRQASIQLRNEANYKFDMYNSKTRENKSIWNNITKNVINSRNNENIPERSNLVYGANNRIKDNINILNNTIGQTKENNSKPILPINQSTQKEESNPMLLSNQNRPVAPINHEKKDILFNSNNNEIQITDEKIQKLANLNIRDRINQLNMLGKTKVEKGNMNLKVNELLQNKQARKEADIINSDTKNGDYFSSVGHIAKGLPIEALNTITKMGTSLESLNPNNPNSNAHLNASKVLTKKYQNTTSNIDNDIVRESSNVSGTIGGMIPSIIANLAFPGSGQYINALNVGASSYQDTLNNKNNNKGQALLTGGLKGGSSFLIEKLTGGNFLTKGSLDDVAKRTISSNLSNNISKRIASTLYEVGGEIAEEQLENQVGYVIDKLVNNKEINKEQWLSDFNETNKNTLLTTMVLKMFGLGGSTYKDIINQENLDTKTKQYIEQAEKIIDDENLVIQKDPIIQRDVTNNQKGIIPIPLNKTSQNLNTIQNSNEVNPIAPIPKGVREKLELQRNIQIPIENSGQMLYNNLESEGGINEQVQQRGLLESNGELSRILEEKSTKESREYTRGEYQQWEDSIQPTKQYTNEQVKVIDNIKRQYGKDIVFFDGTDSKYSGGASYNNKNKINIDINQVEAFGQNKMIHHEILESDILHNKDMHNNILEPAIQKIMNDPNFEKQKEVFWKGQDGDIPPDYLIAKDILCDRFAEIKTGEKWDYENVLSQETNMTIDYGVENFYNELAKGEQNSFLILPQNKKIQAPITKEAREQLISKQEINNQELKAPISKEIEQYLIKENKNKKNTEELPDTKIFIEDKRIKERATLKEIKDTFAQRFVNKGHYIDKLAKETGNKKLIWKYDRTMNTFNEAQISIGKSQINSKGEIVGKSLIDIFKPSQEIGLNKEFEDYLLNKHNIARTALSKSIYGDNVTAPQSKKIIESYEEKYPQFKEWSKEVNNYNDNNLRDLVDNGMVSESTYKNLRDIYGDYVPTYRDITETMADFEENKVGSNPLKYATESDKAILSVKEGMAEQTLSIKKAIRINDLGVELYETLGKNKIMDSIPIDHMSMQIIGGDVIQKAGKGNNTFAIFQDGEITYFKISDEIYSAFSKDTIQNKINNSKVTKTLLSPVEKLSKVQRNMLTTYSIGFAFNNPIKDFQDALFNTKYSTISFLKNYSKALYNIGINGDWYQKYQNNGGAANTYFDYEKGLLPIGNKNPIKKFANKIKDFNEVLEQAPRLAEYISTIENGGTIDEALYNAADLTTNFKRGGDVAKAANKYGANFFNASIQGLDKFYRNISGQRGWKGYANIITKATLFQIAPAIINGLLLSDDDDYEDLPEYTKDNYFLFKLGNGKFFRIPKGRVSSVIGGLARRVLETGQGKKVDWKSLKDTTINQLAPNNPLTDNLIAPVYQATKNEAWYGGEIVNKRLQKLPQGEQYDESTDLISKFIGEKTNISPKKINYVLDQYSGGVGDVILPMLTPQAENNILEDKFTTDSVIKNKHVSEYYDKLDELEKNKNSSKATDNDILKYKYMASESDKLSELYNEKRKIQNSGIKDSDKKQKVRQIQEQINKIVIKKLNNKDNIKIKDGIGEVDGIYFRLNKNNEWEKMSNSENNNEVKKYKEALSLGLTNKSYQTFKNKISPIEGKKDITGKSIEGSTNGKKALEIMNTNYSTTEKNAMLKLMSPTAKNPETTSTLSGITKTEKAYTDYFALNKSDTFFQVKLSRDDVQDIQDLNISQDEFMRFAQEIGNVKGQKDKNGKTISGSKKKAVANYIDGLNLSSGEKAILFAKAGYPEKKYKQAIYSYINGLKLSATRKKEIWDGLGYK